jgi:hypothetical protein
MDAARSTAQVVMQTNEDEPEIQVCLTQNSVLQVTLSGPALVLTILSIIISIQIFQPSLTCTLVALAPLPWIIHNDYENFISLGPGGTPATFFGYLTITYLRLFALSDPYTPATLSEQVYPTVGYYQRAHSWLPKRNGPRPKIAGIAPHRQINQSGCKEMYQMLRKSLQNVAIKYPDSYRIGQSCFEKKGLALFAREPINSTCRGEICHIHHSDRSMHMNLHPDDAKVVLEKGWGERHPLARGGWMKAYVPREFIMVYAPRDRIELDVVCRIIEAAGYWVSGERFEMKAGNGEVPERVSEAGEALVAGADKMER